MSRLQLPRWLITPVTISRRARLYGRLALLFVIVVPLIVTSGRWLRTPRIDLTRDHLYTLTPGTLQVLDGLRHPLRLTLYFSEHATRDLPQLRSYQQRVREMLLEMAARSHGHIRLQVTDPVPYSDDEASALGSGLTPIDGGSNGERVFFGLAGRSTDVASEGEPEASAAASDKTLVIPFFDPSRESFLEYDIVKQLYQLNQTSKPQVGVISSLPIGGSAAIGQPAWVVAQQLSQLFDLTMINPDQLSRVDDRIKVLLLIAPRKLSDNAQYAIDQFVLRGGHLIVFVDPDVEMDAEQFAGDGSDAAGRSSDIPRLLASWGVLFDSHHVVLDRSRALPIELAGSNYDHPAMLNIGPPQLNRNDVVTASLQRINVSTIGHFDLVPGARARLTPLLQSSPDAELVSVQRVLDASTDPSRLLQGYKPDNVNYALAVRVRGAFDSAFPERSGQPGHIASSAADAEVILVADTDLLSDRLWVEPQTVLGQAMVQVFANNGDFVSNLVDNLSGSSALLSIRGRSASQRPFTRVQALRNVADQKFLQKERELQQELADTRRRIAELQPAKGANNGAASEQQRREIEQFRQRQLAINKQLRDVQHQLNAEIDTLGSRIKAVNIVLTPSLVVLIGLLYGWRRGRRSRQRR